MPFISVKKECLSFPWKGLPHNVYAITFFDKKKNEYIYTYACKYDLCEEIVFFYNCKKLVLTKKDDYEREKEFHQYVNLCTAFVESDFDIIEQDSWLYSLLTETIAFYKSEVNLEK